jgi:site-specific recombinase XerD
MEKECTKPSYAKLVHGYVGFLTGTGKSLSTIGSYKSDLALLEAYLQQKKKSFYELNEKDFSHYQIWLEKKGFKTNTRRRKLLSAKSLVKYAVSRKKLSPSKIQFVKTPERMERLPWIPSPEEWGKIASELNSNSILGKRNRLAFHLFAETGILVAELCALRWDQWNGKTLSVEGKKPRTLPLSSKVNAFLKDWKKEAKGKYLFPGFNRHGITSEKMTPRGIELLFRQIAAKTKHTQLHPKTLRHYAIASWLRKNVSETEIQKRLGVHKQYSLNAYRKHIEVR